VLTEQACLLKVLGELLSIDSLKKSLTGGQGLSEEERAPGLCICVA
jgi:hypothetical protein